MRLAIELLLTAGMVTALSGPLSAADMGDQKSTPHFRSDGQSVSVEFGQEVYNDHCALCHGLTGKGDGPRSAYYRQGVQYIPDMTITGLMSGRDEQLLQSIREGVRRLPEPAYVMPQFKYILSKEEMESAFLYVKSLSK